MGGGERDPGLDDTAQAGAELVAAAQKPAPSSPARGASPLLGSAAGAPPLATGTADTAPPGIRTLDTEAPKVATDRTDLAPSGQTGRATRVVGRHARAAHVANLAIATLSAANIVYFVLRFLVSATPPALHKAYVGEVHGGPFASMDIFNGPFLTLARITFVAVVFITISTWVARQHRRDTVIQLVSTGASVAGLQSIAVAVLTSNESLLAPRIVSAVIYVLMPVAAFSIGALFPTGKLVPRWSIYVIPIGVVPFAIQAWIMYATRGFSVPVAGAGFPAALMYLGFQWHRYRKHATLREQHQIKWLSYAAVVFMALQFVAISLIPLLAHRESPAFPFLRVLFELLLASSYLLALTCLLFSAARYRLWDVDRVINRTIVYAVVTGLLGSACALGYFAVRAALASFLHASVVSAAIAIALMLALFAPTRRRIARWIDRRFYGIGLDYERLAAAAVARAAIPTTGTELGAYDGLVLLGRGGMGAVYRAHHPDFGVPVALKVMSPQLAGDPDAQARFRRESQILEGLRHPNVVPFLAAGHEAGLAFIAMQYVEGEDLGALVRRRGALTIEQVAPIVDGIAAALDHAHVKGVVHRDIKPANVLLEGDKEQPLSARRPLVMDFGVARLAGDPSATDSSLVGSLPYIAPEQIQNADRVDARADVYALGATVYQLVTGRPPFVESTALGLVLAHLHQPPDDPRSYAPTLPARAAAAIVKALAKPPADRFETAGEFAAALQPDSLRK